MLESFIPVAPFDSYEKGVLRIENDKSVYHLKGNTNRWWRISQRRYDYAVDVYNRCGFRILHDLRPVYFDGETKESIGFVHNELMMSVIPYEALPRVKGETILFKPEAPYDTYTTGSCYVEERGNARRRCVAVSRMLTKLDAGRSPRDNERMFLSRYLYAIKHYKQHGVLIPSDYEVDHIDHDHTNDRIENLQLLPPASNTQKNAYNTGKVMAVYRCANCGISVFRTIGETRRQYQMPQPTPMVCSNPCRGTFNDDRVVILSDDVKEWILKHQMMYIVVTHDLDGQYQEWMREEYPRVNIIVANPSWEKFEFPSAEAMTDLEKNFREDETRWLAEISTRSPMAGYRGIETLINILPHHLRDGVIMTPGRHAAQRLQKVKELLAKGLNGTQIAKELGLDTSVITRFITDNNLQKSRDLRLWEKAQIIKGYMDQGMRNKQICDLTKTDEGSMVNWRKAIIAGRYDKKPDR